jgi:nitrite reductase (NADH) large subunit
VLAVVGYGMVGHRFVESALAAGLGDHYEIVVIGEEPRPAYDRVHLSAFFDGSTEDDLLMAPRGWCDDQGVRFLGGEKAVGLDTEARTITTDAGTILRYAECILATGSYAFVPPVANADAAGTFVYRTLDDLEAIRAWATAGATTGAVVGGGLLGLEAANALRNLGVTTTVVEFAPRLMAVQLDEGGGRTLRRHIEGLGLEVRLGHAASAVDITADGRVAGLTFADPAHEPLAADMVIFAAGIRPRDDLARAAGLEVGERGGIVVDDTLATSAPNVWAIGECALHQGRIYGLVAPGNVMADVAAQRLAAAATGELSRMNGTAPRFEGADMSTKLKLLGVDVASVGVTSGEDEVLFTDPVSGVYKKLVLSADHTQVLGGILVGDASAYNMVLQLSRGAMKAPKDPALLIAPAGAGGGAGLTVTDLPDDATICSCNNVTKGTICSAVRDQELETVPAIKACTKAGTTCASCVPLLKDLLNDELRKSGKEVHNHLCEHFAMSRAELFDVVRITGIRSFAALVARHGTGRGCDICKPAVASMFASLVSGYILDGEQATLQDTNDHFLANMQKDGTYSVVPRVPGGEITPQQLIVIGEIARDFDLYTKITGGQRIDLFGARVEQLPAIWGRLVDAGMESGHAYGKALRTVKSCVGSTWCRFGVQDSVSMAVELELRYRGLRAPHKVKMAVSGCARECAEAQSKDIGVIATESGYNVYVGGNGGMRPQHAALLAENLDPASLIKVVDRFLMYYVRTADRLERTATWLNKLEGGLDQVKRVVLDDALGICDELEADMARHVENYECEWKATLEDPIRLSRFVSFVNLPEDADPDLTYVRIRGQRVPADKLETVEVAP